MLSITYLSSATSLMSPDQLVDMLHAIRPRNAERGVTGMLLYSGGNIIQTLEGPDDAVLATYGAITADPRHKGLIEIFRDPVEERSFPDWSMGFSNLRGVDADAVEGFNGFLQNATGDDGPGPENVLTMLRVFREHNRD